MQNFCETLKKIRPEKNLYLDRWTTWILYIQKHIFSPRGMYKNGIKNDSKKFLKFPQ